MNQALNIYLLICRIHFFLYNQINQQIELIQKQMFQKGQDFWIKSLTPPSEIDQLISAIENQKYFDEGHPIELLDSKISVGCVAPFSSFTQAQFLNSFESSPPQEESSKKTKINKIKRQGIKTKCKNVLPNIKKPIIRFLQKHGVKNPAFETFKKSQCSLKTYKDLFKDPETRPILSKMFESRYLKRQYFNTRCPNSSKFDHMFRVRQLGKIFVMLQEEL